MINIGLMCGKEEPDWNLSNLIEYPHRKTWLSSVFNLKVQLKRVKKEQPVEKILTILLFILKLVSVENCYMKT